MAKIQLLTDDDIALLQEIIREVRHGRKGAGRSTEQRTHTNQASDIYIAKVPASGIPAITLGGTDKPGSAQCYTYRINANDELVPIGSHQEKVYNLSTQRIDSYYALITKTKDGKWIVQETTGEDKTGTGTECISSLGGHVLDELTTGTPGSSVYLLGIDTDGCLKRYPSGTC